MASAIHIKIYLLSLVFLGLVLSIFSQCPDGEVELVFNGNFKISSLPNVGKWNFASNSNKKSSAAVKKISANILKNITGGSNIINNSALEVIIDPGKCYSMSYKYAELMPGYNASMSAQFVKLDPAITGSLKFFDKNITISSCNISDSQLNQVTNCSNRTAFVENKQRKIEVKAEFCASKNAKTPVGLYMLGLSVCAPLAKDYVSVGVIGSNLFCADSANPWSISGSGQLLNCSFINLEKSVSKSQKKSTRSSASATVSTIANARYLLIGETNCLNKKGATAPSLSIDGKSNQITPREINKDKPQASGLCSFELVVATRSAKTEFKFEASPNAISTNLTNLQLTPFDGQVPALKARSKRSISEEL